MTAFCDMARDSRDPLVLGDLAPRNPTGNPRFLVHQRNPHSGEGRSPVTFPILRFVAETTMAHLDNGVQLCHSCRDDCANLALECKQLPVVPNLLNGFPFRLDNGVLPSAPDTALCLTSGGRAVPADPNAASPETLDKHGRHPTLGASSEPNNGAYAGCRAADCDSSYSLARSSHKGPGKSLITCRKPFAHDFFRHPNSTVATTTPMTQPGFEWRGDGKAQRTPQPISPDAQLPHKTDRHGATSAFNITSLSGQSEPGANLLLVADAASTLLLTARMLAAFVERQWPRCEPCPDLGWSRPRTLVACA
ncbi:uncharacterized protein P884DRAFT_125973 [Thermothelomyces heterothallicus CBS 202.75]|uniref:uncharacterized protein n=1 Tax=Thermothelomyces heterothallicus CBS 202.75 TaxID=1149848 RepID=UPI0037440A86